MMILLDSGGWRRLPSPKIVANFTYTPYELSSLAEQHRGRWPLYFYGSGG
jgi:hypothetical protein